MKDFDQDSSQHVLREVQNDADQLCMLHLEDIREDNLEKRRNINDMLMFLIAIAFILFFLGYLIMPDVRVEPLNDVYIEMAIFLFTVISGFTVSRQNNRYRQIMQEITSFDGSISAIYREFNHFGGHYQNEFKHIALRHYEPVIARHQWDYNIVNYSTTLSDTYELVHKAMTDDNVSFIEDSAVVEIKKALTDMQRNRKDMIALHSERVPQFQMFVIFFLALMLVITISAVTSYGDFVESLLKASFATAIVATVVLIKRLDTLDLFESFLGEHSAQDVIDIFNNKK